MEVVEARLSLEELFTQAQEVFRAAAKAKQQAEDQAEVDAIMAQRMADLASLRERALNSGHPDMQVKETMKQAAAAYSKDR